MTARLSRHGLGRSAWASPVRHVPRAAPAPHRNCGAQHPHNTRPTSQKFICTVNVHGLTDGKHEGAHGCYRGGECDDRWNDKGEVWDSAPLEAIPASERGNRCDDAWGPSGLAVCFNPLCKACRAEVPRGA